MRHINGVYTQRYNWLRITDGPLFRGRYKAILVDSDAYLLQLSRYIHRNPIDMKNPMVSCLEAYTWSSYPAYIGKAKSPDWLDREMVYDMLGCKQRYRGYADYIKDGVDEELRKFYQEGNIATIIGGGDFKGWVYEELLPELRAEEKVRIIQPDLLMSVITRKVSTAYGNSVDEITRVVKGPQSENEARKVAMYLCQELSAAKVTGDSWIF